MKIGGAVQSLARAFLLSEKGLILPVGLVILALVTVIGTMSLIHTTGDLRTSASYKTGVTSFHLAEAAADYMREALNQNNTDFDSNLVMDKTQIFDNGGTVTWDSSSVLNQLHTGATGDVVVVSRGVGTNLADLTSRADIGDSTQTVKLVIERGYPVPQIPAAITTVSNGTNQIDLEDTSLVTGNEESGNCVNLHGFVWNPAKQLDIEGGSLEGAGATPPTPSQRQYDSATDDSIWADPAKLLNLVNDLASRPGVVNITGSAPPATLGTATDPQITVWDPVGPTTTTAATTGYGILIIEAVGGGTGHLTFSSTYPITFHGLVIVRGKGEITFNSNSVLHGGVIAVSQSTSTSTATKVDFQGNSKIFYNCDSLAKYAGPLMGGGGYAGSSIGTVTWKQEVP